MPAEEASDTSSDDEIEIEERPGQSLRSTLLQQVSPAKQAAVIQDQEMYESRQVAEVEMEQLPVLPETEDAQV